MDITTLFLAGNKRRLSNYRQNNRDEFYRPDGQCLAMDFSYFNTPNDNQLKELQNILESEQGVRFEPKEIREIAEELISFYSHMAHLQHKYGPVEHEEEHESSELSA